MSLDSNINNGPSEGVELPKNATDPLRVYVVADEPGTQTVSALLGACDLNCSVSNDLAEVHGQLLAGAFDVVVLSLDTASTTLCEVIRRLQPHASVVMVADHADVHNLTCAMRAGAVDVLIGPPSAEEIEDRIREAGVRSRDMAERERRSDKLRGLSRRIGDTRQRLLAAIEAHEQSPAKPKFSGKAQEAEPLSEFRELVRAELDVEALLRTSLEYMLEKTGPTNAAMFLAGPNDLFGLGAYVHFDLPRATVEPMLQRLADEACPAIAQAEDVLRFEDAEEFISQCDLGPDVATDQHMVAVPCHHEGECLAVLVLFRNSSKAFDNGLAAVLDGLRKVFAEQLGRVIWVHNRLQPEWPDEPED